MNETVHADIEVAASLTQARYDLEALSLDRERKRALGLFLRHLALGEGVAQRIAARQVGIAPDRRAARFHRAQARHETVHARLFDLFAAGLGAPPLVLEPCPYQSFEQRVGAALERGDYLETIAATQVVLEALGEVLLLHLDRGMTRHGVGFHRLRRQLRAQEAAHHAFGEAFLLAACAAGADIPSLRLSVQPYLALADAMIAAGAPALAHFAIAPEALEAELRAQLPPWIVAVP